MKHKTFRELGGEIWAELQSERKYCDSILSEITFEQESPLIDLITSVLGRHDNTLLKNDPNHPVFPRPVCIWPDDDLCSSILNFGGEVRAEITIRELCNEIMTELQIERINSESVLAELTPKQLSKLVEFLMAILARHDNAIMINDRDIPVVPRPY